VEGSQGERSARLLVLGAGPAQLGLLATARERGLFVIAADRDPAAPGFRLADRRAIISAEDEQGIERLALAENVAGVIAPGIDWPVAIAARVAARAALPHPIDPQTAVLSTSKLRQRERFAERGVPQPRFAICRTIDEAHEAAGRVGFPCVLKPPDRQGQKGLVLVADEAGLDAAFEVARGASRGALVLVEELVDGPEVTVSAFSVDGAFVPLTVTDREVAAPPAFGVALAHVWPSERDVGPAVEAARAAAEALGIENGPTYTQLRLGPEGPRVGELAARLGGGHDAELCAAAVGVDANALALAAALGEPVERPRPEPQVGGACVRFLVPPAGVLGSVAGVDEARAVEGVLDVRVYREPGYVLTPLRRGSDRAGAVLAVGGDRAEALERAARAADLVRFETVDAQAFV
jgi:biotin carboxylase